MRDFSSATHLGFTLRSYTRDMKEARTRLHELRDQALPAMPAMLGGGADELLSLAVSAAEGKLISARPHQVHWQPGRALTVVYDASVAWAGQRPVQERLVAMTGARLPDEALVLEHGDARVGLWALQQDPLLPGLAVALDAAAMHGLLTSLGVRPDGLSLRLRAYRPGRRAVVQAQADGHRLFVKVVRPRKAAALQKRHALLARRLPVPHSHGWSDEHGLVVLEAMPGATLREALGRLGTPLPDPRQIAALLDSIEAPSDAQAPPDLVAATVTYGELLGRILPDLEPQLRRLIDGIGEAGRLGPVVPVHGDLHEAQLMVAQGQVVGLLDVDTVGLGHRVDDWATMVGHLATRLDAAPKRIRPRIQAYAKQLLALADAQVDPVTLRQRAAAVVLGLATGPFRVQTRAWPAETRRRVALAEQWLATAQRIA